MRSLFFVTGFCLMALLSIAQSASDLISELKTINNAVVNTSCISGRGMLISNRAMNLFLSYKIGSYLSDVNDLSFYKNNVIVDAMKGTLSVNHNFFQPNGIDEPVRSFLVAGAKANIANAFAAAYAGKQFNNELGFTIKQTWISKTTTHYNRCEPEQVSNSLLQHKEIMDAQRAVILHTLENEIKKKNTDFENAIHAIRQDDIPGQEIGKANTGLQEKFYSDLKEEYTLKFADLQYSTLVETNYYNHVTACWTSISTYIPLLRQKYFVAESFSRNFEEIHAYPWELTVSHTRFWEGRKIGRIYFTLSAEVLRNNSIRSDALYKTNRTDYKNLGGTDTLHFTATEPNEDVFIGFYKSFFTPVINGRIIWFPFDSHVGVSVRMDQNIGTDKSLTGKFGIPIVLIDKKGEPAANFEFQVRFFDLNNETMPVKKIGDKTSVGLTVGIPFSKIIY